MPTRCMGTKKVKKASMPSTVGVNRARNSASDSGTLKPVGLESHSANAVKSA